ncbi:MAG: hypothetical protein JXR88_00945 [Clostridia bacterium]|nr:hypothetical protein [Clostridia bacterium]
MKEEMVIQPKVKNKHLWMLLIVQMIVILILVGVIVNQSIHHYEIVLSQLSEDEIQEVVGLLKENDIAYKVDEQSILVHEEQLNYVTLLITTRAFSSLNENTTLEITAAKNSQISSAKAAALKEGLKTASWIDDATVDLYMPYVPEGKTYDPNIHGEIQISVVIKINENRMPTSDDINSVVDYLMKSVSDLKAEQIRMIDDQGQSLYGYAQESQENANILSVLEKQLEEAKKKNETLNLDLEAQAHRIQAYLDYYKSVEAEMERLYKNNPLLDDTYQEVVVKPLQLNEETLELTVEWADGEAVICKLDNQCQLIAPAVETLVYQDMPELLAFLRSIIGESNAYHIEILFSIEDQTNTIIIHHIKMM